jgi:hypothetical protein
MFEYNIILTEQDYITFNQYHMSHSANGKKAILMFRLLMPIISLCALLIFWIAEADPTLILVEAIVLGLLSVYFFFYSKKILMKSVIKTVAKLRKEGKLPFNQESTITFDETHILEKTDLNESKISYQMIEKIADMKDAIYIYFSAMQAYIIPNSVFESDEHKKEFLDFMHTKVHPK